MQTACWRHGLLGALLAVAIASSASTAEGQQAGVVTGRITDQNSGRPVPAGQVTVVGTTLGAQSNAEGVYTIRGVTPGVVQIRATRIGFAEFEQRVTVAAGQPVTVNIAMRPVAVTLSAVVTTATGEQRRNEVGNAIARINVDEIVETRPVTSMSDLLTARTAGVQVLPGTQTGVGARVRIRGTSSLSLSNDPIYVIDGVRMESSSGSSSIGVGGSLPSRVGDINPEEIESIEVVKGPSAATLYGTDAANGVIVIKTKRGVAGAPQWTVYTEQSAVTDRNTYPTAYRAWRTGTTTSTNSTAGNGVQCLLSQVTAGTCMQDSVTSFNLFDDPETTPFGAGYRNQYGLQVSGGSETVRYFVHGELENETGVSKIPDFDIRRLNNQGIGIREEWNRPNALSKATARANLNITLPRNAEIAINTGYISSAQRLPQSDNNTTGLLSSAYGGPGLKYNTTSRGDTLYGYRVYTPGDIFQETVTQEIDRFIGSMNANWQTNSWLALRGNFGVDYTGRVDSDLCRFEECSDFGSSRLGFKVDNRTGLYAYTADIGATGRFTLTEDIGTTTTVGAQFYRNLFDRNGANGSQLPPGATSVSAGAVPGSSESTSESRTLGAFIEQNVAFADRLFVTGAVRSDRNSAFGADFETVFYPKLAVSWVVSQEPFFGSYSWLDELRLRSAYGASGVQPGTTDAVQFFAATAARVDGAEIPGLTFSALGNRTLKPERSTEFEAGVDGTFWNSRVNVEFTYYDKVSKDALVSRILPPSVGTGATTRLENLGQIRNSGLEGLISAQLLQRRSFGWDVSLNASTNKNKLVDLGEVPPIIGQTIRQIEGFPLNGYWQQPLESFSDANSDGIISVDEIVVGEDPVFRGYSIPRVEVGFTNGFELFNRVVRISSLIDYKGGHKLYNNTERIRCQSRLNCNGLVNPDAPLAEQARVVALREHPSRTLDGFIEDASFVRLREVALTLTPADAWANRLFRGRRASVTLAARNLATWTDYTGIDPESNYSQGDVPVDFQTIAPPTYFTFRLTLGF